MCRLLKKIFAFVFFSVFGVWFCWICEISYKQVNGHFVVVEQINRNKSEFIFKTMFKEKGDYKNALDYKKNIKENKEND